MIDFWFFFGLASFLLRLMIKINSFKFFLINQIDSFFLFVAKDEKKK